MTPEQIYFAQFSGESLLLSEIIIQTNEDMQDFYKLIAQKWADDHAEIIAEWREHEKQQGH